jgi:hypothetical protein
LLRGRRRAQRRAAWRARSHRMRVVKGIGHGGAGGW